MVSLDDSHLHDSHLHDSHLHDSHLDDRELLARVAGGDRRAFEVLYRRYHPRLLGFLRRRPDARSADASTGDQEIVDDVLFTVWTDASRFEGRSRVSSWIFGIAYRQLLSARRRTRTDVDPLPSALPSRDDATRRQERHELVDVLHRALGALSPEHRRVVELTYFEDCSYPEISSILGIPLGTVKTRMFHARRRLRDLLVHRGWPASPGAEEPSR